MIIYRASMTITAIPTQRLDRMAIGLSGLCLVHCLATSVVMAVLASAGGLLGSALIHETGLVIAMVLGAVALTKGAYDHGYMMPSSIGGLGLGVMAGALTMPHDGSEVLSTMVGVAILALGHRLNAIAGD